MPIPAGPGSIESINVAVVRDDLPARAGATGIDKRPAVGPVWLRPGGVEGDTIVTLADHGGPDQAVYAYSTEDLEFWTRELGRPVRPGNVGENLTLSGIDCSGAVLGERWQVGDAVLRVRAVRTPCRTFSAFLDVPDLIARFIAAGRPGAYLAVERAAPVRAGEEVRVLDRPAHGVTVADLMAAMTVDRERVTLVATARADLGARPLRWLERTLAARERGRAAAS